MNKGIKYILLLIVLTLSRLCWSQGVFITSPKDGSYISGDRMAVIVKSEPSRPLMLFINGDFVKTDSTRGDGTCDILNLNVPYGGVKIYVEAINSKGNVVSDSATVFVIGPVNRIELLTEKNEYVADGKSVGELYINLYDKWGIPSTYPYTLNLNIKGGEFVSEDEDSNKTGFQMRVTDGTGKVRFKVGEEATDLIINVKANNIEEEIKIPLKTYMRDLILVGYLGGEIGYHDVGGGLSGSIDLDDPYIDGMYGDGRGAFFMKGSLLDKFLVTASYDSKVGRRRRVFRSFDPERLYPVYGDNSSIFYEAQAATPLFLKIEKDQSYAMWGDFNTDFKDNELTFYNRTYTGVDSKLDTRYFDSKLFVAPLERKTYMDVIQGQGVSGYYYVTQTPVCEGTEKIRIEVHDRFHPEVILSTESKSWPDDYEMDYESGAILFRNPVLSQDGAENPVFIIVTYETPAEGLESFAGGLRGELNLNDMVKFGGTIIREEDDLEPYTLGGLDLNIKADKYAEFNAEAGFSNQDSSGSAFRVETKVTPFHFWSNNLYWRKIGDNYNNPFSSSVVPGERKFGAKSALNWKKTKAVAEFWNKKYSVVDMTENCYRGEVSQEISYFKVGAGIESRIQDNDTTINSALASGFLEFAPRKFLSISLKREQNIGKDEIKPTATTLGADFKLSPEYTVFARFMDAKNGDETYRLATAGVRTDIAGVKAHGEYTLIGGIDGYKGQALIGLNNRIEIIPHVFLDLSYERAQTVKGSKANDFWAYSNALEITPDYGKIITKGEFRRHNTSGDQLLAIIGGGLSIRHSLSLLFKEQFFLTKGKKGSYTDFHYASNKMVLGLAIRPVYHDFINVITKAEHKMSLDRTEEPYVYDHVALGNVQAVLALFRPVEITARYAAKINWQIIFDKHNKAVTDLMLGKIRIEMGKRVDLAFEGRVMNQYEAHDKRYGLSPELGIVFIQNTRFAVGYNLIGYQDDDFSDGEYWSKGFYVSLKLKFNEKGLGIPEDF
ncbi:hypothetical protein JXI42_06140 [bacterium]|nr:hypothetical protein [bacterium]